MDDHKIPKQLFYDELISDQGGVSRLRKALQALCDLKTAKKCRISACDLVAENRPLSRATVQKGISTFKDDRSYQIRQACLRKKLPESVDVAPY